MLYWLCYSVLLSNLNFYYTWSLGIHFKDISDAIILFFFNKPKFLTTLLIVLHKIYIICGSLKKYFYELLI